MDVSKKIIAVAAPASRYAPQFDYQKIGDDINVMMPDSVQREVVPRSRGGTELKRSALMKNAFKIPHARPTAVNQFPDALGALNLPNVDNNAMANALQQYQDNAWQFFKILDQRLHISDSSIVSRRPKSDQEYRDIALLRLGQLMAGRFSIVPDRGSKNRLEMQFGQNVKWNTFKWARCYEYLTTINYLAHSAALLDQVLNNRSATDAQGRRLNLTATQWQIFNLNNDEFYVYQKLANAATQGQSLSEIDQRLLQNQQCPSGRSCAETIRKMEARFPGFLDEAGIDPVTLQSVIGIRADFSPLYECVNPAEDQADQASIHSGTIRGGVKARAALFEPIAAPPGIPGNEYDADILLGLREMFELPNRAGGRQNVVATLLDRSFEFGRANRANGAPPAAPPQPLPGPRAIPQQPEAAPPLPLPPEDGYSTPSDKVSVISLNFDTGEVRVGDWPANRRPVGNLSGYDPGAFDTDEGREPVPFVVARGVPATDVPVSRPAIQIYSEFEQTLLNKNLISEVNTKQETINYNTQEMQTSLRIAHIEAVMTRRANDPNWMIVAEQDFSQDLLRIAQAETAYHAHLERVTHILGQLDLLHIKEDLLKVKSPTEQRAFIAYSFRNRLMDALEGIKSKVQNAQHFNDCITRAIQLANNPDVDSIRNDNNSGPLTKAFAVALHQGQAILGVGGIQNIHQLWRPDLNVFGMTRYQMQQADVFGNLINIFVDADPKPLDGAIDTNYVVAAYAPVLMCTKAGKDIHNIADSGGLGDQKYDPSKGTRDLVRYLGYRMVCNAEEKSKTAPPRVTLKDAYREQYKPRRTSLEGFERGVGVVTRAIFVPFWGTTWLLGKALVGGKVGNRLIRPWHAIKAGDRMLGTAADRVYTFLGKHVDRPFIKNYEISFDAISVLNGTLVNGLNSPIWNRYKKTLNEADSWRTHFWKNLKGQLQRVGSQLAKGAIWLGIRTAQTVLLATGLTHFAVSAAVRLGIYSPYFALGALRYLGYKPGIKLAAWLLKVSQNLGSSRVWQWVGSKLVYGATLPVWGPTYVLGKLGVVGRSHPWIFEWPLRVGSRTVPLNPLFYLLYLPQRFYMWYENIPSVNPTEAPGGLRHNRRVVHGMQYFDARQRPTVDVQSSSSPRSWRHPVSALRQVSAFESDIRSRESQLAHQQDREVALSIFNALTQATFGSKDAPKRVLNPKSKLLHHDIVSDRDPLRVTIIDERSVPNDRKRPQSLAGVDGLVLRRFSDIDVDTDEISIPMQNHPHHAEYSVGDITKTIFSRIYRGEIGPVLTRKQVLREVQSYRKDRLGDARLVVHVKTHLLSIVSGVVRFEEDRPVRHQIVPTPLRTILEGSPDFKRRSMPERVAYLMKMPEFASACRAIDMAPEVLAYMIALDADEKANDNKVFLRIRDEAINEDDMAIYSDLVADFKALRIRAMAELEVAKVKDVQHLVQTGIQFQHAYSLGDPTRIELSQSLMRTAQVSSDSKRFEMSERAQDKEMASNFVVTESFEHIPVLARPLARILRFQMIQERKMVLTQAQGQSVKNPHSAPIQVLGDTLNPKKATRLQVAEVLQDMINELVEYRDRLQAEGKSTADIDAALSYVQTHLNQPVDRYSPKQVKAQNRNVQTRLDRQTVKRLPDIQIQPEAYKRRCTESDLHYENEPVALTLEAYLALLRPAINQTGI